MTTKTPFFSRKMLIILAMGISSGLPFALIGSTLQAWLTSEKVSLQNIGLFSLIGAPYALKFLWAPFVDGLRPKILGRRRAVLLFSQSALIAVLIWLSGLEPGKTPELVAIAGLLIAFLSATQDIAIDAYRAEVLEERELGSGVAVGVLGYRLGLICSGAGALILADHLPWHTVYQVMAGVMALGIVTTRLAAEPDVVRGEGTSLKSARDFIQPFRELLSRAHAIELALFIVIYRAGDVLAGAMTIPFLLSLEFSNTEIGVMQKSFGPVALICGSLTGGLLMARISLYRALIGFGIVQAISTAMYLVLQLSGKNEIVFALTVAIEQFSAGLGTAAFLAFLISLCDRESTATHYAVLTSLVALARLAIEACSGYLAAELGWTMFFLVAVVSGFFGVFLLLARYGGWNLSYNQEYEKGARAYVA